MITRSARLIARAGLVAATLLSAGCHHRASAPPPAPAPAAGPSLYERLGGEAAITAVVGDFVGRVGADARVNAFFRGVDLEALRRHFVEQICVVAGGPCRYTGRSMRVAHQGLAIRDPDFDAVVEDLVATLDAFHVPDREQRELLTALGGLRRDIVGR